MIIKVDIEGRKALDDLFDVALKAGGIKNFNAISKIMDAVEALEEPEPEEQKK